jgi:PAS domain S-box-containing protein
VASDQRPVEIILARGLMSNLTTPAFLVDVDGTLVFFNEAAAEILGLRYEEAGPMGPTEWAARFAPLTPDGEPIAPEELPLSIALREMKPAHRCFRVRSMTGDEREIDVSAFPIVGNAGIRGAMSIFWAY